MFGQTSFFLPFIIFIAVAVTYTDLRSRRIYNWMTFPLMAFGLAAALWISGWRGLESSLLGIALGFGIFFVLYVFRVLGAGDVKFLMALGALGGMNFVFQVAILSICLGGLIALVVLVRRGEVHSFLYRLSTIMTSFLSKGKVKHWVPLDAHSKIPFGIAIAVASICAATGNPLAWGIFG